MRVVCVYVTVAEGSGLLGNLCSFLGASLGQMLIFWTNLHTRTGAVSNRLGWRVPVCPQLGCTSQPREIPES